MFGVGKDFFMVVEDGGGGELGKKQGASSESIKRGGGGSGAFDQGRDMNHRKNLFKFHTIGSMVTL